MELLSILKARSLWGISFLGLNPHGKKLDPELLNWLQKNYSFSKSPSSFSDVDETKALAFVNGGYSSSKKDVIAFDLRIYSDGFVIDSRVSTEENDRLFDEILGRAAEELGLVYNPEMEITKLYVSEFFLKSESELAQLNPKLEAFSKRLSKLMKRDFNLSQISFWTEPKASGPENQFLFERRRVGPFTDNVYFSSAPLPTRDHLRLVREFEKVLVA